MDAERMSGALFSFTHGLVCVSLLARVVFNERGYSGLAGASSGGLPSFLACITSSLPWETMHCQ